MATGERSLLQRTKALVEGLAREVAAQQAVQAQRQQQRQADNPFAGESHSGQLVNVEANDRHFATEVGACCPGLPWWLVDAGLVQDAMYTVCCGAPGCLCSAAARRHHLRLPLASCEEM